MATPGFWEHQTGAGALTHEFEIGGIRSRRMVLPYQVWMLCRIAGVLDRCDRAAVEELVAPFPRGRELLNLNELLAGCRVQKVAGVLSSAA